MSDFVCNGVFIFNTMAPPIDLSPPGGHDERRSCHIVVNVVNMCGPFGLEVVGSVTRGEEETLKLLRIFTEVLKQAGPGKTANADLIVQWAKAYTSMQGIELPTLMLSAARLARFLNANAPVVGLQEVGKDKGSRHFKVAK